MYDMYLMDTPLKFTLAEHGIEIKGKENLRKDVTVRCIPFSANNSKTVVSTAIIGMNLSINHLIKQLKPSTYPPLPCCLSFWYTLGLYSNARSHS